MSDDGAVERQRLEALRRSAVAEAAGDDGLVGLVDLARDLVGADVAALTFVDTRRTWPLAAAGALVAAPTERRGSLAGEAIDAGNQVRWTDADAIGDVAHPWDRMPGAVRSLAATAVAPGEHPVGALEVGWSTGRLPDAVTDRRLRAAADQLAVRLRLLADAAEYRRFVELAPDAMAVVDLDGAVELCNAAFAHLLGRSDADALVGASFLGLVAADDRDRVAAQLAEVLVARRATATTEFELCQLDGRCVLVDGSAGRLRGTRRGLQVLVRDVSGRRRSETERARLSEQLARAHRFETVGKLAGGLAHDLNNLLTVLVTNLAFAGETVDDLASGGDLDTGLSTLREDLEQIRAASSRTERLTRELLEFATRTGGVTQQVSPEEVLVPLRRLLERSLGPQVDLTVDVEPDLPELQLDPSGLEQAVTNLVLNARDAMPDGGAVRIVARSSRDDDPLPGGRPSVVISVHDTGAGMSAEVLARAFEPLFTTKPADRGSGLGLATVEAFAQRTGGRVDVASSTDDGTCVSLLLPLAERPAGRPVADAAPLVLLADPADASRQVIAAMLTQAGYQVAEASTADGVRDLLGAATVDVVACEMSLVGSAGVQVADLADRTGGPVPVVLLSSTPDVRDEVDGHPLLTKPFSSERLHDAVAAVRVADR